MVAAASGCRCHISMPDDAALEKIQLLSALGARVQRVRPVLITHPGHFVNVARRVSSLLLGLDQASITVQGIASLVQHR